MRILALLLCTVCSLGAQQLTSFRSFHPDTQQWKNVVDYTQEDRVAFSFDSQKDIFAQYDIKLYDYQWQSESLLTPFQYSNIYQNISTYPQVIVSGFSDYTQFNGFFPDFGTQLKHSGNYRLVFTDVMTMDTLMTQDYFVIDPIFDISIKGTNFNTVNLYTTPRWEVNVDLKQARNIRYDSGKWKLAIVENYNMNTIKYLDQPSHHQYQKWVYTLPNPVQNDRIAYIQLDTDRYLKQTQIGKRTMSVPTYYPNLVALNNLKKMGGYTMTDLTPSPEYIFFDFKIDLSDHNLSKTDTIYLSTLTNRLQSPIELHAVDDKGEVFGKHINLKEGYYNLNLTDKQGHPLLKVSSDKNVQTTVYQFFLYYKANGTLNYEILGYKELKI